MQKMKRLLGGKASIGALGLFMLLDIVHFAQAIRNDQTYLVPGEYAARYACTCVSALKLSLLIRNHATPHRARIDSFGFDAGGTIDIRAKILSPTPDTRQSALQLAVCTETELSHSALTRFSAESLCQGGFNISCAHTGALWNENGTWGSPSSSWAVEATAQHTSTYILVLLNCNSASTRFQLQYHLVNPGGEELSTAQIPFKAISAASLVVWMCVLVFFGLDAGVWLASLPGVREDLPTFPLVHAFMGGAFFVRFCASVLDFSYWRELSREGEVSTALWASRTAGTVAALAAQSAVLLLLGKGLSLTRRSLSISESRAVVVAVFVLTLAYTLWLAAPGFFTLAFVYVIFALVLRLVYVTTKRSGRFAAVVHRARLRSDVAGREHSGLGTQSLSSFPGEPRQQRPDASSAGDGDWLFRLLYPHDMRGTLQARQLRFFLVLEASAIAWLVLELLSATLSTVLANEQAAGWQGSVTALVIQSSAMLALFLHLRVGVLGGAVHFNADAYNAETLLSPLLRHEPGGTLQDQESTPSSPRIADRSFWQSLSRAWEAAAYAPESVAQAQSASIPRGGAAPRRPAGHVKHLSVVILNPDATASLGTVAVWRAPDPPQVQTAGRRGFLAPAANRQGYAPVAGE